MNAPAFLQQTDADAAYEAWRPALVAYYQQTGSPQLADNLGKHDFPLCSTDRARIDGLRAALELAPVALARAA